jgi:hypothetical protein
MHNNLLSSAISIVCIIHSFAQTSDTINVIEYYNSHWNVRTPPYSGKGIPQKCFDWQNVINDAISEGQENKKVVFIPKGKYPLNGEVILCSGTHLYGEGDSTILLIRSQLKSQSNPPALIMHKILQDYPDKLQDQKIEIGKLSIYAIDIHAPLNIVEFRGARDCKMSEVKILIKNSENNWGINFFGSNQHITVEKCSIINNSPGNLGGCVWIRSSAFMRNPDDSLVKTYGILLSGCTFESSTLDEIVAINDGTPRNRVFDHIGIGSFTSATIENCCITGKKNEGHTPPSFGLIIAPVRKDWRPEPNPNTLLCTIRHCTFKGAFRWHAIAIGNEISTENTSAVITGCTITNEYGQGITGRRGVYTAVSNSKINVYGIAVSRLKKIRNSTIISRSEKGICFTDTVVDCIVSSRKTCFFSCGVVKNSKGSPLAGSVMSADDKIER